MNHFILFVPYINQLFSKTSHCKVSLGTCKTKFAFSCLFIVEKSQYLNTILNYNCANPLTRYTLYIFNVKLNLKMKLQCSTATENCLTIPLMYEP